MPDPLLILTLVLLVVTLGAAGEYYRQLRKAQREYEKARGTVEDVVLSFNRQLKRETEKVELIAYKLESNSAKSDGALTKSEGVEKWLADLEPKIATLLQDREKLLARLNDADKKLVDAVTSQGALAAKVSSMEERIRQVPVSPELNVGAVIPIKREKALAQLTETELSALEFLAQEGPKTAPEIKEKIKLSREHTARLMKKLYEEGYLERDTGKIPFKYSVKKEMEKLLKRTENQTA
jgi:chromosome segregation ATPase